MKSRISHLKKELQNEVEVTVVSDRDYFLFNPSLIWLPFGKRNEGNVTFKVAPTFDKGGVHFIQSAATEINPDTKKVDLANGDSLDYDYLVIATGTRNKPEHVPGLFENTSTITMIKKLHKETQEQMVKRLNELHGRLKEGSNAS